MFLRPRFLIIILGICYHLVNGNDTPLKVHGDVGETVVLKPKLDPTWPLKRIEWFIWEETVIATFQNDEVRLDRSEQFTGRLKLNTATGDLTIKDLTAKDSMNYRVELVGSEKRKTINIELSVQEPLRNPDISVLSSSLDSGNCTIGLSCSSLNSKAGLSWKPEDGFNEHFWSYTGKDSSQSVLWSTFSNRNVTFYCIATEGSKIKASSKAVRCSDAKPCNNCGPRHGESHIRLTLVVIVALGVVLCGVILAYKGEICSCFGNGDAQGTDPV